jgi:hypothetical protein
VTIQQFILPADGGLAQNLGKETAQIAGSVVKEQVLMGKKFRFPVADDYKIMADATATPVCAQNFEAMKP